MDIKFRNWDNIDGGYTHSGNVAYYPSDRFICEQFTGCKDKEGQEIYEGDILRYWRDTSLTFEIHAVKRFPTGAFKMDCNLEGETFKVPVIAISHKCEILGNIHENNDLLDSDFHSNPSEESGFH